MCACTMPRVSHSPVRRIIERNRACQLPLHAVPTVGSGALRALQLRCFKHGVRAAKKRLQDFYQAESKLTEMLKKHDELDRCVRFALISYILLSPLPLNAETVRESHPELACLLVAALRKREKDTILEKITKAYHSRSGAAFYTASSAIDSYYDFLTLSDSLFYEHFRMTKQAFLILANRCDPYFARNPRTPRRKPIPGRVRLLHVLRILAQSTASFRTESIVARTSKSSLHARWLPTVAKVITQAIPIQRNPSRGDSMAWKERKRGFIALQKDRTKADKAATEIWRRTFAESWDGFNGVVEVFDGCVLPLLEMPRGYGVDASDYRHWSKGWSINSLAGVDANGRFTSLTAGYPGAASDVAMLRNFSLYNANEGDPFSNRADAYPPGCFAIGDGGFGLLRWLILPFVNKSVLQQVGLRRQALKLFNFKLAQLRVVVEQAFGRWKGRWRILKRIPTSPETAGHVAEACACLHNFLEEMGGNDVLPHWIADIEAEEREEEEQNRIRIIAEEALAQSQGPEAMQLLRNAEAQRAAASATLTTLEAKAARLRRLDALISCVAGGEEAFNEDVCGIVPGTPNPAAVCGT